MACLEKANINNFLRWNKVVGSLTLSQLQANGLPDACDNTITDPDVPPFGFGNALDFDGVDDYVAFNTAVVTTGEISISCWFKVPSLTADFMFGSSSGATNFGIGVSSPTSIKVHTESSTRSFTFDTMVADTWHHLFAVRGSDSKWTLYINGTISSTTPVATTGAQSINLDVLGRRNSAYMDVILDEFAVWDGVAGTAQNASNIWNSGTGNAANEIILDPDIYYHFNKSGTDTVLTDVGNDNNDGTLTNFPASGMWVAH
jgi:hypothetical protein